MNAASGTDRNEGAACGRKGFAGKIYCQFTHPTGVMGSVVGRLLAVKNARRSKWVLSRLDLRPDERVLEIGYGPGVCVEAVAGRGAHVSGVDHSEVMHRQATRRNRIAVAEGRVDLRVGSMSALPFADGAFTRVFSINCFQFSTDPERDLAECRRVLAPGGRLAIAIQPRNAGATAADATAVAETLKTRFESAGFCDIETAISPFGPVPVAFVAARRPD